jgi:capsular exopolysaccharide synthesis family protein
MSKPHSDNLPDTAEALLPAVRHDSVGSSPSALAPVALEPVSAEGEAPPGAPSPLTLASLTKAFRHRWLLALTVGLALLAGFGGAAYHFLPATYTAYALLRVSDAEPQPLIPDQRFQSNQVDRYFENTQVALVKSRPIVLAALRRPGIGDLGIVREQPDPAVWLEENLKVAFLEKTDILRIALDGTQAKELATLVNAVKDAYLEDGVNAQRNKKLAMLDDLENVRRASVEQIRSQRDDLRQLAETLKSTDSQAISVKQKAILEEYAALRKELALIQAQRRGAEVGLAVHKDGGKADDAVPDFLVEQAVESDAMVVQKKVELAQFDSKFSQIASLTEPGHPARDRHEKERKALAQSLDQLRDQVRSTVVRQLREKTRGEVELKNQQVHQNVEVWKRQEELLKAEVDRIGKEAQGIGLKSFELELKRGEIDQAEAVIKRLREERERLQVELQSTKQRVTVLHSPEVPNKKNIASHLRLVGFIGLAGLLLGLFGVCYWEARHQRIMTRDEVVHGLGCRVIGVLPWVGREFETRQNLRGPDPVAALAGSVDGLRAMLLCDGEGPQATRTLMVTSAVAREGKTTLASHLAVSMAQAGRRTLLVDCDFRRPELHRVFDMPRGPGLTEVLRGEADLAAAVRPGPVAGLFVLTAGEASHRVSQAQVMSEMRKILDDFRQHYDFVLVDCSPVLPVADALFLGKRVDGVLISVRPTMSQFPLVSAALERLASLRIPVLGAVVNGVRDRSGTYGYEYLVKEEVDSSQ